MISIAYFSSYFKRKIQDIMHDVMAIINTTNKLDFTMKWVEKAWDSL